MATNIDIINMALDLVGAGRIAGLTDESFEGRWANLNYAPIRDALLTEHVWAFSEQQLTLTTPSNADWEGGYVYDIPAGTLHVYRCYEDPAREKQAHWRRLGDKLIADYSGTLYALGCAAPDEADFPSWFVQVLAHRLAVELTIPVTRSTKMLEQHAALYNQKLSAALATDGSESRSERTTVRYLAGVRYGQSV